MYDALERVVEQQTPDASVTLPRYNEAGLLERLDVRLRGAANATAFVENVDYNARGQRTLVRTGNGVTTRFTYDGETFRLIGLRSTRPPNPGAPVQAAELQNLSYLHDPVGNIVAVHDAVSYANASVSADGLYEYDALYRLVRAEGREHPGQQPSDTDATLLRLDHPNDLAALVRYEERYRYDPAGNIEEIAHRRPPGAPSGWTRRYAYATDSNRLLRTSLPGDAADELSASYTHDEAGNLTRMPHLPLMRWDHADRLQATSRQVVTRGTPETTYYTYDAAGQRVRKVTETAAQDGATPHRKAERLYLGAHELFRAYSAQSLSEERQTLHIMDHETRLALAETVTITPPVPGGPAPSATPPPETRLRYQLQNHLSSATLELDATAQVISYEEYHPYGTTSLHAASSSLDVSPKRYRYTSKERDSETGFTYHGARYYAPWLARWASGDPAGDVDGPNLFAYVRANPIAATDPTGTSSFWDDVKNFAKRVKSRLRTAKDAMIEGAKNTGRFIYERPVDALDKFGESIRSVGRGAYLTLGAAALYLSGNREDKRLVKERIEQIKQSIVMNTPVDEKTAIDRTFQVVGGYLVIWAGVRMSLRLSSATKTALRQLRRTAFIERYVSVKTTRPFVPEEYWQKNAPMQVRPGVRRLDHWRISARTGRMERSRVIYDQYGRQKYRIDMTDHMRPSGHTNPHLHETTYFPKPGNPVYSTRKFNLK